MNYKFELRYADGTRKELTQFACANLDYWNIRQYRLLLFVFSEAAKYDFCQLVVTPIVDKI